MHDGKPPAGVRRAGARRRRDLPGRAGVADRAGSSWHAVHRGKVVYGDFLTGGDAAKCPSGRCFSGRIDYGIENWLGPQGVPAQVDRLARDPVTAVVRIDPRRNAVLADLLINGVAIGR